MTSPTKLLIVDDEPHIRAFIRKLVQAKLGRPAICEAADEPAAVAAFQRERPDLVLLDINLVGNSGLVVLGRIRALDPAAVVVMLTSVAEEGFVEKAAEAGAAGYLLKDTVHSDLAGALGAILQENFGVSTFSAPAPAADADRS